MTKGEMKRMWYSFLRIYILVVVVSITGCSATVAPEIEVITVEPTRILPTSTSVDLQTATAFLTPTDAPVPTQSPFIVDFAETDTGEACTELGCDSSLQVRFDGFMPENYMVEVIGDKEDKVILHCFEPDQSGNFPIESKSYPLNSVELEKYQTMSTAFNKCSPDARGIASIWERSNNSIDEIIVYCDQWVNYVSDYRYEYHGNISCRLLPDGFIVDYLTQVLPETVSMIVSWDAFTKTFEFQPDYETNRPNGQGCEPECFYTHLWLTLP